MESIPINSIYIDKSKLKTINRNKIKELASDIYMFTVWLILLLSNVAVYQIILRLSIK